MAIDVHARPSLERSNKPRNRELFLPIQCPILISEAGIARVVSDTQGPGLGLRAGIRLDQPNSLGQVLIWTLIRFCGHRSDGFSSDSAAYTDYICDEPEVM